MSQEKHISVQALEQSNGSDKDLDATLLNQALELFMSDDFKRAVDLRSQMPSQMPPVFDQKCIAGLPDQAAKPNSNNKHALPGFMEKMEELCRCVMVIPPSQILFPAMLVCNEIRKNAKS